MSSRRSPKHFFGFVSIRHTLFLREEESMEDSSKDQSSAPAKTVRSSSKLRYPLRSATKSKEDKPTGAELSHLSAPKKGTPASSVTKSVGVLELSGKDKSGKPPRRLSVPAKSTISPVPKSVGNITPISEAREKRSVSSQGKNVTPVSDASKSSSRRRFSVLSSASYWLSQIKLSESATKHKISLGFFKLALEAGCEPLQRMRDELQSYARRHNLAELGEPVKELFESYNLLETFEQLQVSETCSQVPEEGTRSSDDDVRSSSSAVGARKLKPKALSTDAAVKGSPVTELAKADAVEKDNSGRRNRGSWNKNSTNTRSALEIAGCTRLKKAQNPSRQECNKGKIKKQGNKAACEQGRASPPPADEPLQENKENTMEEISSTEV